MASSKDGGREALLNGKLGIVVVLGSINAGNILPYVRGSQIELGHTQIRIKSNRVLEFLNGVFVFSALVGLHTFVELVARFELVASGGCHRHSREQRYQDGPFHAFHWLAALPVADCKL